MSHRLFFALWPDDNVRRQLVELQKQLPAKAGRPVAAKNLHITLHFLGPQSEAEMACARHLAKSIDACPFELQLAVFGYFRKAGVFWLGCCELPEALVALYDSLVMALEPCGYEPDTRSYKPHITLLRKNRSPVVPLPTVNIRWMVDAFVLVESVSMPEGVSYQVIEEYRFQGSLYKS